MLNHQGAVKIMKEPTVEECAKMTHTNLIKILRFCPYSKFFGMLPRFVNTEQIELESARRLVQEIILECDRHKNQGTAENHPNRFYTGDLPYRGMDEPSRD